VSATLSDALALPVIRSGGTWPTFTVSADDRDPAKHNRMVSLSGPTGTIVGNTPFGAASAPSRSRTWGPTNSSSPSSSPTSPSSPPAGSSHPSAGPAPALTTRPSSTAKAPAHHLAMPVATTQQSKRKWNPGKPATTATPPPSSGGASPSPRRAVITTRTAAPTPGKAVGGATAGQEGRATAALTLSILAIIAPFVAVALIAFAGNILAIALAITAIVLARGALQTPALSGSGRTRSRWAVGISIVVIIIWVIAFTQGV
jgi:hypothetical protein